ncbi:T9SS type A sorting domain-containing protein [bacterium]|nr:T9SS type A sorting domain-containing protein [bacterium]
MRKWMILCATVFQLFYTSNLHSAILFIPEVYNSIEDAITNSSEGDTLLLADGEYNEAVVFPDHGLTLASHYLLDRDSVHIANTTMSAPFNSQAILSRSANTFSVTGITFSGCNTSGGEITDLGGALHFRGDLYLTHCVIENCSSSKGGALYKDNGYLEIENCEFINNSASSQGGAILINAISALIRNSYFSRNDCERYGGAVYFVSSGGEIQDCKFYSNTSGYGGAGIMALLGANLRITYTEFLDNVSGEGTAIYVNSNESNIIQNCCFKGNIAEWAPEQARGGVGAAIEATHTSCTTSSNLIEGNTAEMNAAGFMFICTAFVTGNIFRENIGHNDIVFSIYDPDEISYVQGYGNLFLNNYNCEHEQFYYGVVRTRNTSSVWRHNDFMGNTFSSASAWPPNNLDSLVVEDNFWGHRSGPYHEQVNPEGQGDTVLVHTPLQQWSETPFTDFQRPTSFSLRSPPNGFTTHLPVSFEWNESTDPNRDDSLRYWLEISTDTNFAPDVTRRWKLGTTTHQANLVLPPATYYWRVKCLDPVWLERFSNETRGFEVTSDPAHPAPFDLLSPENGTYLNDSLITFAWSASSIPFEQGEVYNTLFLTGVDEQQVLRHPVGSDTTITLAIPQWETMLSWYVAAVNDSADTTWSNQLWSFYATDVEEETHDRTTLPETFSIVSIHPNPFNSSVTVRIAVPRSGDVEYHVVDLLGRVVVESSVIPVSKGIQELNLAIHGATGTYYLILTSPEGIISRHRLILVK